MTDPNAFNLVDEPWIPVLLRDGSTRLVSLAAVFSSDSDSIADLALNPYERVAVFRLILCVAQAALGPERLADESAWLAAKPHLAPLASDYLRRWRPRFFLYGSHAFLQSDELRLTRPDAATPCDKFAFHLASGNNSTLFDHAALGNRVLPDPALALAFLSFQNFSAGGLSGSCVWDGHETERTIQAAPCREQSMLHGILLGASLVESAWLNLLTAKTVKSALGGKWGRPAWELDALDRRHAASLPGTLLGQLVPFSRTAKLTRGSPFCILGEGFRHPQFPAWRDPMGTVRTRRDSSGNAVDSYVSANPARLPWRDLSSILLLRSSGSRSGPLALRHLDTLGDADFTLWTGGLCADKAKEVASVEWTARLSVAWLEEPSLHAYESAMAEAEAQSSRIWAAVFAYAQNVKPVAQDYKQRTKDLAPYAAPADRAYWDLLAQPENQRLAQAVDSPSYLADWRGAILSAAKESYARACPAASSRQIEAYAQGLSRLNPPKPKDPDHG